MDCEDAQALLEENDLKGKCVKGNATTDPDAVGTVYQIDKEGNQEVGTTITLTFYTEVPDFEAPTAAKFLNADGSGEELDDAYEGTRIRLSWDSYEGCEANSGFGDVTEYAVTLAGASFEAGNNAKNQTFTQTADNHAFIIVDPNVAPGQVEVTYTATCGSGEEAIVSEPSDPATLYVTEQLPPEPDPEPTDDADEGDTATDSAEADAEGNPNGGDNPNGAVDAVNDLLDGEN